MILEFNALPKLFITKFLIFSNIHFYFVSDVITIYQGCVAFLPLNLKGKKADP